MLCADLWGPTASAGPKNEPCCNFFKKFFFCFHSVWWGLSLLPLPKDQLSFLTLRQHKFKGRSSQGPISVFCRVGGPRRGSVGLLQVCQCVADRAETPGRHWNLAVSLKAPLRVSPSFCEIHQLPHSWHCADACSAV